MIVVTGAAGFIGSNIVAELNARGEYDVVVCDWFRTDGRWMNLRHCVFSKHIFPEQLLEFIENTRPKAIFHLGANSSTTASDGDEILRLNVDYTVDLLDKCTELAIPLIYASSAATYGDGEAGYSDEFTFEKMRNLRPLNLYGWSKAHVDTVVAWRNEQKRPLPPKCIGLKFFNVYGPNEFHKNEMMSVVAKNFSVAKAGESVKLFKSHKDGFVDGGQLRDFVYVQDVVDLALWFLDNGPACGIFNCGTGVASSFRQFIEALYQSLGMETSIEYIPMPEHLRARYQYFTEAALANLRAAGYDRSFLNVREGVARYVDYLTKEMSCR